MIGYLMSLCVFYFLAAAYWAQVFPGGNGAPQKFYFFLVPAYWIGSKVKETSEEERGQGVVVSNIRKMYGEFEAVKSLSMTLEPGTITALLGHNGAGKKFWNILLHFVSSTH
jgi:ABC-type transport system involved in cytochrome bd biosynthesis fused ATPase/permease subunit